MQKAEGNQDQTAEAARTAMAALPPAPPPAQMQHRSTSAVHVTPSSATHGGAVFDTAHVHSHGVAVGGGAASVLLYSQQQQAVAPSSSSSFSLGTTSSAAGGAPLHASVLCSTVNPPAAAAAATVRCDQRRVLGPRWRRTLRRLWHRCRALVTFVFFWALARVGIIERKGGAAPNSSRAATRAAVVGGGGHALRPDTTARVQTLLVFAFHAAVLLWLSLESPTAAYAPTESTPSVFSSLLPAGLFSFFSSSWPSPHASSNGPLRFVNEGGHDGEGTNGGVSEGEDEYSSFFDGDYAEDGEWFVFSYSGDDGEGYGAAAAAVSGGSGAAVGARQSVADAAAERLRSPRTLRVDV